MQNIVHNNLCNGKYKLYRGVTPTAYFLCKICIACGLEPKIPEECLVTQLAYYYADSIVRAKLYGQIKMITALAALLDNYEHKMYYRHSRQREDHYTYNNANNNGSNNNNNDRNQNNNNNKTEIIIIIVNLTTITETTVIKPPRQQ